jgi:hypothetical protein
MGILCLKNMSQKLTMEITRGVPPSSEPWVLIAKLENEFKLILGFFCKGYIRRW